VPALCIFGDRHTAGQVRPDDLSNTHLVTRPIRLQHIYVANYRYYGTAMIITGH
jgi:hypothetical protein